MFKTIQNAWRIPDLRKKILFTLFIIIVFRIGASTYRLPVDGYDGTFSVFDLKPV